MRAASCFKSTAWTQRRKPVKGSPTSEMKLYFQNFCVGKSPHFTAEEFGVAVKRMAGVNFLKNIPER